MTFIDIELLLIRNTTDFVKAQRNKQSSYKGLFLNTIDLVKAQRS